MINGVLLTPLKIIKTESGDVLHSIKSSSQGFNGFGEAYFSEVKPNAIKGWKMHNIMTLNISVPIGKIRFVLFDERSSSDKKFQEVIISKENYFRLTVPPRVWLAFQGLSKSNSLLLNVANVAHDPKESVIKDLHEINFDWSNKK